MRRRLFEYGYRVYSRISSSRRKPILMTTLAGIPAVAAISSHAAPSHKPGVYIDKASVEQRAADFITQQCIIQGIPGCSVAVIKDGNLIWTYSYGYCDIANNQKLTPYSIMRIASITKPMTATGIAKLLQLNKLQLDETFYDLMERLDNPRANKIKSILNKKYPKFYEIECKKFTVLQLCNHTGGFRHYDNNDEYLSTKHYKSLISVLQLFANEPLRYR